MKSLKSAITGATALAIVGAGLFLGAGAAHAAGTVDPSITGDPNAANGTISFYDASGAQITTGSLSSPFTSYAVASSATTKTGTTKATLFVATPDHTKTNSLQWFNQQLTAASSWPLVGAPAAVTAAEGAGVPAVAIGAGDGDLAGAFSGAVNDPTTGFDHIMQIRMEDSGPGKTAGAPFWQADLLIDTTAGTWTQVYPTPPPSKTGTSFAAISANPTSPAPHGSTVSLTSTLSAADSSHPAGSVDLFDGTTNRGAATFTASTGVVSATDTPSDGPHSYTFRFTPSDTTTYAATTSAAASYTVNAPTTTTTALSPSPVSPSTVGQAVTLNATVTPSSATGTVQFLDGSTNIGAAVTVSGGTASTTTSALTVNTHSLTAKFIPDSGAFVTSTSPPVSYQVDPLPATTTTTTLAVSSAGPVDFGTSVDLTATVSPTAAAGTVQFYDGTTALGAAVALASGTATKSVSTLSSGTHSLTAKFLPADTAAYGTSTSSASSFTVNAQATTTVLTVSPSGTADHGSPVSLTATLTPSTAIGTVSFFDGSTAIGSPVTVNSGTAQFTTSALVVATHSLTATFTPTTASQYVTSTSPAVSLVVQNPPPGASTTALTVTPAGPIVAGAVVTLKAKITPTAAAGTVQFLDGSNNLGAAVTVSGGVATTTTTPAIGTHSYTAAFTPSDTTSYVASTSPATTLVVNAPATPTTTTLTVTPAGPVEFGTSVTFAATVAATHSGDPAPSGGSVQFKDGSTSLGTSSLTSGAAAFSTGGLAGGPHTITATYLPADPTVFAQSTSDTALLTVNAQPTTTTLAVTPNSPVTAGDSVTLTATVSPASAAGAVNFIDGTTSLGSANVTSGKAVFVTKDLAVGDRSLTAGFLPTADTVFAQSTSAAVLLTVLKAPTISGVSVNGGPVSSGAQLHPGDAVALAGSGFQPGETVSVVLRSTPVTLTSVTAGPSGNATASVTLPTTLSAGSHTLTLHGSLGDAVFRFTVAAVSTPSSPPSSPASVSLSSSSDPAAGNGSLASTGAFVLRGVELALLLLFVGVGITVGARRGRSH
ncbi:MAG TPA: Ig-like domain-containing protein [Jatrophihabitans sp.]